MADSNLFMAGCLYAGFIKTNGLGGGGSGNDATTGGSANPATTTTSTGSTAVVSSTPPNVTGTLPGTSSVSVIITGTASYAFVPTDLATGGLDYPKTFDKPIRGATVEARSSTNDALLGSTVSSDLGTYLFVLPANTAYYLRVRAELIKTTGLNQWQVKAKDNTCAGALPCTSAVEPLWAIDSGASNTGTTNSVRSIAAPSGWDFAPVNPKYDLNRPAAPFAILDTIYAGMQLISTAQPSVTFPPLTVYWSPKNIATGNAPAIGDIGTSYFAAETLGADTTRTMYILGRDGNDTDEYDPSVIAHEYGHYLQSAFSTTGHSAGGLHSNSDKLDMTVAFSEGWGNAWSSMARNNPVYSDSSGSLQGMGGFYDLTATPTVLGWYSEGSVEYSLYKLYQDKGFAPVWAALTGPMKTSQDALATIFSFAAAVRSAGNTVVSTAMDAILNSVNVYTGAQADQWGAGETNNGGEAANLPVYNVLGFNTPTPTCFINTHVNVATAANKLGAVKFYRIRLTSAQAGLRTITANFSAGRDVDFDVFQNRVLLLSARAGVTAPPAAPTTSESASLNLSAGEVIIRVSDDVQTTPPASCATITIN
jgi:hypothetical protein